MELGRSPRHTSGRCAWAASTGWTADGYHALHHLPRYARGLLGSRQSWEDVEPEHNPPRVTEFHGGGVMRIAEETTVGAWEGTAETVIAAGAEAAPEPEQRVERMAGISIDGEPTIGYHSASVAGGALLDYRTYAWVSSPLAVELERLSTA